MIKRIIKKTGHLLHGVRAKLLKTEIGSVAAHMLDEVVECFRRFYIVFKSDFFHISSLSLF